MLLAIFSNLKIRSDTGSFGSLQALPSFLRRFGVKNAKGAFVLPPTQKALLNSLPWLGKIAGCLSAGDVIERIGYKKTMYIAASIQFVGLIGTSAVVFVPTSDDSALTGW